MKPNDILDYIETIEESWLARTGILGKTAQGAAMLARQRELTSKIGQSDFIGKLQAGLQQAIATNAVDISNTTLLAESFNNYTEFSKLLESRIVNEALATGVTIASYVLRFVLKQIQLEKLPAPTDNDLKVLKDLANDFQTQYIAKKKFPNDQAVKLFQFLQSWESTNVRADPYSGLGNPSAPTPTPSGSGSVNISSVLSAAGSPATQFPVRNSAGGVNAPSDGYRSLMNVAVQLLLALGAVDKNIYPLVKRKFDSGKKAAITGKLIDQSDLIKSLTSAPLDGSDKYRKISDVAAYILRHIYRTAESSMGTGQGDRLIAAIEAAYKRKYP